MKKNTSQMLPIPGSVINATFAAASGQDDLDFAKVVQLAKDNGANEDQARWIAGNFGFKEQQ